MVDLSRTKRILVTGASGTIGSAIAQHFLDLRWDVYGQYSKSEPKVPGITSIRKDLATPHSGSELVEAVKPDLVINCAADQGVFGFDDLDLSLKASALMRVNLVAPVEIMSAAARFGAKLCINLSSIEAHRPRPGHALYGASKAALETITRSAAVELAPMRVLGLRLGLIAREGIEQAWPEGVVSWNEFVPLKRMGTAQEVARLVEALASDDFLWATGTTIDFDGGASASAGW